MKNFIKQISEKTNTDIDTVLFFLEDHSLNSVGTNLGAGVYFFREINAELNCEYDPRNWYRVEMLEFVYIRIDDDLDSSENSPIDVGQYPTVITTVGDYKDFQKYIKKRFEN